MQTTAGNAKEEGASDGARPRKLQARPGGGGARQKKFMRCCFAAYDPALIARARESPGRKLFVCGTNVMDTTSEARFRELHQAQWPRCRQRPVLMGIPLAWSRTLAYQLPEDECMVALAIDLALLNLQHIACALDCEEIVLLRGKEADSATCPFFGLHAQEHPISAEARRFVASRLKMGICRLAKPLTAAQVRSCQSHTLILYKYALLRASLASSQSEIALLRCASRELAQRRCPERAEAETLPLKKRRVIACG